MTANDAVERLLEYDGNDSNARELDRLLLRIYENPSLVSYLNAIGGDGDVAELDFMELPIKVVDMVKSLIGPINVEVLAFEKNGWKHTGFRFKLSDLVSLASNNSQ